MQCYINISYLLPLTIFMCTLYHYLRFIHKIECKELNAIVIVYWPYYGHNSSHLCSKHIIKFVTY